jgi:predicted TIM-barrel fold metal-dependent hydrolase
LIKADIAAGVDKAVLVQASSAYAFDNSYVADAVAAYPERTTGVFSIDVIAPDAVASARPADDICVGRGRGLREGEVGDARSPSFSLRRLVEDQE